MPRRLGLLIAAILLLAGCGSEEPSAERPRAAQPASDAAAFRRKARAACAGLHRRLVRLERRRPAPGAVLAEVGAAWAATLEKLRRLDPPPPDRRRFRQMLAHFDRAVRAAKALPDAQGELALASLAGMLDAGGRGATIAQSLGLLTCSAVPPAPTEAERQQWQRQMERQVRRELDRWRPSRTLKR